MDQDFYPLQLFYVRAVKSGSTDISRLYAQKNIFPGGVFMIVQNFDENYVIVPLSFAQDLFSYKDRRTSLEIKLDPAVDVAKAESALQLLLGDGFDILNSE